MHICMHVYVCICVYVSGSMQEDRCVAVVTYKQCVHPDVTVLISAKTADHHRAEVSYECVWEGQ